MISPFRLAAAGLIALGTTCISAVAIAQQGPIKDRHADVGPTSGRTPTRKTPSSSPFEEINDKGGLLGGKLEIVIADETEKSRDRLSAAIKS